MIALMTYLDCDRDISPRKSVGIIRFSKVSVIQLLKFSLHCLPRVRSAIITKCLTIIRLCGVALLRYSVWVNSLATKNKADDLGLAKQRKKRRQ